MAEVLHAKEFYGSEKGHKIRSPGKIKMTESRQRGLADFVMDYVDKICLSLEYIFIGFTRVHARAGVPIRSKCWAAFNSFLIAERRPQFNIQCIPYLCKVKRSPHLFFQ